MKKIPSIFKRDDRKSLCDICGFKYSVKDLILVDDQYSKYRGMVVCHHDYTKVNPQIKPFKFTETIVTQNKKTRLHEQIDRVYSTTGRLPGIPQFGIANIDSLQNYVRLTWSGPQDTGSSPIIGYQINRAVPQYGAEDILTINTNYPGTTYLDLTSSINQDYTYRIAAINSVGTGPFSDYIPYPYNSQEPNYIYICTNSGLEIQTNDGTYIRMPS